MWSEIARFEQYKLITKIDTIIKRSEHQPTMIWSADVTASLNPVVLYATVSVDPV